jgi:hypothetical protein
MDKWRLFHRDNLFRILSIKGTQKRMMFHITTNWKAKINERNSAYFATEHVSCISQPWLSHIDTKYQPTKFNES